MVWCGVVWCGVVWCGVVWCGGVWWGVVCVVWCGVVPVKCMKIDCLFLPRIDSTNLNTHSFHSRSNHFLISKQTFRR